MASPRSAGPSPPRCYCANTALAIAMHQHNVLALAWRWRLGDSCLEPTLRRIATGDLILSSSGSADPANPGVTATPAEGGLLVTGRKRFCSGVPGADFVLTMARVDDGEQPWTTTVMVPTSDPGTEIIPDWDALGMRGSGSNPVSFAGVFVPDATSSISSRCRRLAYRPSAPAARPKPGRGSAPGGQTARRSGPWPPAARWSPAAGAADRPGRHRRCLPGGGGRHAGPGPAPGGERAAQPTRPSSASPA